MYLYPDNLKAKARLWLWELRDVAIIGGALLLAVFALAQGGTFIPIICAASVSSETARMAFPAFVVFTKTVKPIIKTAETMTVTTVVIDICLSPI